MPPVMPPSLLGEGAEEGGWVGPTITQSVFSLILFSWLPPGRRGGDDIMLGREWVTSLSFLPPESFSLA